MKSTLNVFSSKFKGTSMGKDKLENVICDNVIM